MRILNKWLQTVLLLLMLTAMLPGPPAVRAQKNRPASTPPVAPQGAADVAPTVLYYHHDATGNLVALSDENAQVIWRADMRPFGQGTATSTDHPLRFLDQPRERDIGAEDGLYHLRARVYDPLTGRFLGPDPLSLAAVKLENPQRFNRYSYGLSNPYRYQDSQGSEPVKIGKYYYEVRPGDVIIYEHGRHVAVVTDPKGPQGVPSTVENTSQNQGKEVHKLWGMVTDIRRPKYEKAPTAADVRKAAKDTPILFYIPSPGVRGLQCWVTNCSGFVTQVVEELGGTTPELKEWYRKHAYPASWDYEQQTSWGKSTRIGTCVPVLEKGCFDLEQ